MMVQRTAIWRVVLAAVSVATLLGSGLLGCDDEGTPNRCGNGVVDPEEQCDDGNGVSGDGCSAECLLEAFCGNGVLEVGEECDDGNDQGGDGCSSVCQLEVGCGNGRLDYGEACDDDNLEDGDGCSSTCADEDGRAICGNGILEAGEGCDDGNSAAGDGCSEMCQVEQGCGDGEIGPGEECDDGNTVTGDGCSGRCRLEYVCGDRICDAENGETCEKCPADCCPNCGNGVVDLYEGQDPPPYEPEGCDDGNNVPGDGCSAGCQDEDGIAVCGNGLLEAGEECDDGNQDAGDSCSPQCFWEFLCGDGVCDVTNGENCRLCRSDCCPDCGNGVIDPGEACDGNALGGQVCEDFCYDGGTLGCTAWCDIDLSACTGTGPICGDGLAECGEQCDDTDLQGKDCNGLGRDGGTLTCRSDCTYDLSQCGPLLWYLHEDFENPATVTGWSMGGDWEYGTPSGSGPGSCAGGTGQCIGTVMAGNYSNNCAWGTCKADSPPIDLTTATAPALRFQGWIATEGYSFDGCNVKVSTDGGLTYNLVTAVSPAYNLSSVNGQAAWGEDSSEPWNSTWSQFDVDLSAFAGQVIRIRFDFRSDGSVNSYGGCYVDDVLVAEPGAMP